MAGKLARRLAAIEAAQHRRPPRGVRIFSEDYERRGVWKDSGRGVDTERDWTDAEVDELAAAGWMVILVRYDDGA